jgi:hypothetical protein
MNVKRFTCFFRGGHQWRKIRYPGADDSPDVFFLRCERCRTEDKNARGGAVLPHPDWVG